MPTDPESAISRRVSLPVQTDAAPPWYAAGLRFSCTQCGHCCSGGPGYVWLSDADFARIAAFLNMPVDQFTRTYVRRIGESYSLTEKKGYDCVFLARIDGKATCSIYDVRPTQCRTWPFWNQNLHSPDAWTQAAARCPGMCDADAPTYDLAFIEERRQNPESP
jgi:Fe-S-cluster containining protein